VSDPEFSEEDMAALRWLQERMREAVADTDGEGGSVGECPNCGDWLVDTTPPESPHPSVISCADPDCDYHLGDAEVLATRRVVGD